MKKFLSSLYVGLFVTDIGLIVTSATRESAKTDSMCNISQSLNHLFTISYFLLTSAMVLFLLVLLSRKKFWFLSNLADDRTKQVLYHVIIWVISAILVVIASTSFPSRIDPVTNKCVSQYRFRMFAYGVWLVTVFFNFGALLYLYFFLRSVSKMVSSDRSSLRIILSIAVVVGAFRILSFSIALITNETGVDLLMNNYPVGVLNLIANSLTVLQSCVVVTVILINHRVLRCCACCASDVRSSSDTNTNSEYAKSSNKKSQEVSLSVVASETE